MSTIFNLRQCIIGRQLDCSSVLHSRKLQVSEITVLMVLLFDDKCGYNTKYIGTEVHSASPACQAMHHFHEHLDPSPTFLDRLRLKPSLSSLLSMVYLIANYPASSNRNSISPHRTISLTLFPSPSIHSAMPIIKNAKPNTVQVDLGPLQLLKSAMFYDAWLYIFSSNSDDIIFYRHIN